jgi:cytochrome c peroxidase
MNSSLKKLIFGASLLVLVGMVCVSCRNEEGRPSTKDMSAADKELFDLAMNYFSAIPDSLLYDPLKSPDPKVELGRMLYFDPRLSAGNNISCNTCHNLSTFGVDNNPVSAGHKGVNGTRNSPTVYNSHFQFVQFWDGREPDVEAQAAGPILNPVEMAIPDEAFLVARLKSVPDYVDLFQKVFSADAEPINKKNVGTAIGAFERTLITPSPFDKYLNGEVSALSEQQKTGLKTFVTSGCVICHTGMDIGANNFQKFGHVTGPYWEYTHSKVIDNGRFEVTKEEKDRYFFKVPGLRNVAMTWPYFHDGSVVSLADAVRIVAKTQVGNDLSEQQVNEIVDFLGSLTGTIPDHALRLPQLPSSSSLNPPVLQ